MRKQADGLEADGKSDLAQKKRAEAEQYDKLGSNIRDSGITSEQALCAREHPGKFTCKRIIYTSHRAGWETAKSGAIIGGATSILTNCIALVQDKKDLEEALCDIAFDTGKSAVVGYGTGFLGSAIKGCMQQSGNATIRSLAHTGLPAMMLSMTVELFKSARRWARGEIDGIEFLTEIGEKSTGMVASGAMAAIGQIAIPIPVLGGLVGGMLGYALNSMFYESVLSALRDAKLARQDYLRIKETQEAARATIETSFLLFVERFSQWFDDVRAEMDSCFSRIDEAAESGKMDDFFAAANKLGACMGKSLEFNSKSEFDVFMVSERELILGTSIAPMITKY